MPYHEFNRMNIPECPYQNYSSFDQTSNGLTGLSLGANELLENLRILSIDHVKFNMFLELIDYHLKVDVVPPGLQVQLQPLGFKHEENPLLWKEWGDELKNCSKSLMNVLKYHYSNKINNLTWLKSSVKRQAMSAVMMEKNWGLDKARMMIESRVEKSVQEGLSNLNNLFYSDSSKSPTDCVPLPYFDECKTSTFPKTTSRHLVTSPCMPTNIRINNPTNTGYTTTREENHCQNSERTAFDKHNYGQSFNNVSQERNHVRMNKYCSNVMRSNFDDYQSLNNDRLRGMNSPFTPFDISNNDKQFLSSPYSPPLKQRDFKYEYSPLVSLNKDDINHDNVQCCRDDVLATPMSSKRYSMMRNESTLYPEIIKPCYADSSQQTEDFPQICLTLKVPQDADLSTIKEIEASLMNAKQENDKNQIKILKIERKELQNKNIDTPSNVNPNLETGFDIYKSAGPVTLIPINLSKNMTISEKKEISSVNDQLKTVPLTPPYTFSLPFQSYIDSKTGSLCAAPIAMKESSPSSPIVPLQPQSTSFLHPEYSKSSNKQEIKNELNVLPRKKDSLKKKHSIDRPRSKSYHSNGIKSDLNYIHDYKQQVDDSSLSKKGKLKKYLIPRKLSTESSETSQNKRFSHDQSYTLCEETSSDTIACYESFSSISTAFPIPELSDDSHDSQVNKHSKPSKIVLVIKNVGCNLNCTKSEADKISQQSSKTSPTSGYTIQIEKSEKTLPITKQDDNDKTQENKKVNSFKNTSDSSLSDKLNEVSAKSSNKSNFESTEERKNKNQNLKIPGVFADDDGDVVLSKGMRFPLSDIKNRTIEHRRSKTIFPNEFKEYIDVISKPANESSTNDVVKQTHSDESIHHSKESSLVEFPKKSESVKVLSQSQNDYFSLDPNQSQINHESNRDQNQSTSQTDKLSKPVTGRSNVDNISLSRSDSGGSKKYLNASLSEKSSFNENRKMSFGLKKQFEKKDILIDSDDDDLLSFEEQRSKKTNEEANAKSKTENYTKDSQSSHDDNRTKILNRENNGRKSSSSSISKRTDIASSNSTKPRSRQSSSEKLPRSKAKFSDSDSFSVITSSNESKDVLSLSYDSNKSSKTVIKNNSKRFLESDLNENTTLSRNKLLNKLSPLSSNSKSINKKDPPKDIFQEYDDDDDEVSSIEEKSDKESIRSEELLSAESQKKYENTDMLQLNFSSKFLGPTEESKTLENKTLSKPNNLNNNEIPDVFRSVADNSDSDSDKSNTLFSGKPPTNKSDLDDVLSSLLNDNQPPKKSNELINKKSFDSSKNTLPSLPKLNLSNNKVLSNNQMSTLSGLRSSEDLDNQVKQNSSFNRRKNSFNQSSIVNYKTEPDFLPKSQFSFNQSPLTKSSTEKDMKNNAVDDNEVSEEILSESLSEKSESRTTLNSNIKQFPSENNQAKNSINRFSDEMLFENESLSFIGKKPLPPENQSFQQLSTTNSTNKSFNKILPNKVDEENNNLTNLLDTILNDDEQSVITDNKSLSSINEKSLHRRRSSKSSLMSQNNESYMKNDKESDSSNKGSLSRKSSQVRKPSLLSQNSIEHSTNEIQLLDENQSNKGSLSRNSSEVRKPSLRSQNSIETSANELKSSSNDSSQKKLLNLKAKGSNLIDPNKENQSRKNSSVRFAPSIEKKYSENRTVGSSESNQNAILTRTKPRENDDSESEENSLTNVPSISSKVSLQGSQKPTLVGSQLTSESSLDEKDFELGVKEDSALKNAPSIPLKIQNSSLKRSTHSITSTSSRALNNKKSKSSSSSVVDLKSQESGIDQIVTRSSDTFSKSGSNQSVERKKFKKKKSSKSSLNEKIETGNSFSNFENVNQQTNQSNEEANDQQTNQSNEEANDQQTNQSNEEANDQQTSQSNEEPNEQDTTAAPDENISLDF